MQDECCDRTYGCLQSLEPLRSLHHDRPGAMRDLTGCSFDGGSSNSDVWGRTFLPPKMRTRFDTHCVADEHPGAMKGKRGLLTSCRLLRQTSVLMPWLRPLKIFERTSASVSGQGAHARVLAELCRPSVILPLKNRGGESVAWPTTTETRCKDMNDMVPCCSLQKFMAKSSHGASVEIFMLSGSAKDDSVSEHLGLRDALSPLVKASM